MSLTREDRLRELELFPRWRLTSPMPLRESPPTITADLATIAGADDHRAPLQPTFRAPDSRQTEPRQAATAPDTVVEASPADTLVSLAAGNPSIVEPTVDPAVATTFAQDLAAAQLSQSAAPIVTVPQSAPTMTAPTITTPWLLYAPGAIDADSQALLANMMRAMSLSPEVRTLQLQPVTRAQIASTHIVLFGLAAANACLGTDYTDIAAVRGQRIALGDAMAVITYHPHEMLSQPTCKKAVWHDVCLLLAKKE